MKLALVPVEPSEEMLEAETEKWATHDPGDADCPGARASYAAMLSARDTGPEDVLFEVVRAALAWGAAENFSDERETEERLADATRKARCHPALRELMDGGA